MLIHILFRVKSTLERVSKMLNKNLKYHTNMKKQLRLFLTMLLLAAFSSVWAEEVTITFSEKYSSDRTMGNETYGDLSFNFKKNSSSTTPKYYTNGTAVRFYGGNTLTITSPYTITKIVITFGSDDGSNTITTNVGTYNNGTWTGESNSVKFTCGGNSGNRRLSAITVTFNSSTTLYIKTGDDTWNPYVYTWDDNGVLTGEWNDKQQATDLVTISGIVWHKKTVPSSNFSLVLSDGQGDTGQKTNDIGPLVSDTYIVYNSETNDGITNYQYSIVQIAEISADSINVKLGQTENSIINVNPTEAQVEYISEDETIATIDSEGVITGIGVGETTITVKTQKPAVNGRGYVSSGAKFNVTVSKDKVSTPYISVPTGTYNSQQTVSIYCSNASDATIYYTTDGSDPSTSDTRIVYNGPFTVLKTTTIKAYAECENMYSSDIAESIITLKTATPTFTPVGGTYTSEQNVTITSETEDAKIYYTIDGTEPTTSSSTYSGSINVSETTTIKALAVYGEMENSDVASATFTISELSDNVFIKATSVDDLMDGMRIIVVNEEDSVTLGNKNSNNNNFGQIGITLDSSSSIATAIPNDGATIITLEKADDENCWYLSTTYGYLCAASSSKNYLRAKANKNNDAKAKITFSNDTNGNATIQFQGDFTRNLIQYNQQSNLFACYESATQKPVQIYYQPLKFENVVIPQPDGATGEGYTTYVTMNPINAASTSRKNIKLYKVVEFDATKVVIVQLGLGTGTQGESTYSETIIPAETPILVKADFGDCSLVRATGEDVIQEVSGNLLRSAVDGVTPTANDRIFILQYPKAVGAYGFHLLGTGIELKGRRAYLNGVDEVEELTTVTNAKQGIFFFGEETDVEIVPDNIEAIAHSQSATDHSIYDLQGRKVGGNSKLPKGIYITNGKKFVVK